MLGIRNQAKATETHMIGGVPDGAASPADIAKLDATAKEKGEKNPHIQGARGLFALFVFFYHIHHAGLSTFPILDGPVASFLLGSLEHGVELFFGISGIVILGSLTRKRNAALFMWDRIARLFPVLWASTVLTLIVMIVYKLNVPSTYTIVGSFLALPPFFNINPVNPIAWTLAFEMMLYWYCAVVWKVRLNSILVAIAMLAAAVALIYYPRTMMMLAGAIVFYRLQKPSAVDKVARYSLLCLVAYLLGLRALVVAAGGYVDALQPLKFPLVPGLLFELGIVAVTGIGCVALVGIIKGYGILGKMLETRLLVWLGTISYSFYLWHIPIVSAGKRILRWQHLADTQYGQTLLLIGALPLTLVVATLSYEIFEARISVWLRRLFPARAPALVQPVPAKASVPADT